MGTERRARRERLVARPAAAGRSDHHAPSVKKLRQERLTSVIADWGPTGEDSVGYGRELWETCPGERREQAGRRRVRVSVRHRGRHS
jgi:hypothetical protein